MTNRTRAPGRPADTRGTEQAPSKRLAAYPYGPSGPPSGSYLPYAVSPFPVRPRPGRTAPVPASVPEVCA